MPVDYGRYPKDWKQVSLRIRARSGGQCECVGECGLHPDHRCVELNGKQAIWAKGRVVLTVAHLNHQPQDCRDENLKAMCQRCHLRYDVELHTINAALKRREGKARADLFPVNGLSPAEAALARRTPKKKGPWTPS